MPNNNTVHNPIFGNLSNLISISLNKFTLSTYILLIILLIVIILITYYLYYASNTYNSCYNLSQFYHKMPPLNSINNDSKYKLKDFYVKTAYNCCCVGNFKNDYVNLCALSTCLKQGARCLDFEIYSVDNKPVVAASSIDNNNIKETYNYIDIQDIFNTITNEAFSSSYCPNNDDPLILHFRIMSNNCKMYNNLANIISKSPEFNAKTLGVKYSKEYYGSNLGDIPISKLKRKIIIIVDNSNPVYQNTKLEEYVNISSSSSFMRLLRFKDTENPQNQDLINFNKKNMTIVLPDVSPYDTNPNFDSIIKLGCQFIGMSFQNNDSYLIQYNDFFNNNNSAFVLKSYNLRKKLDNHLSKEKTSIQQKYSYCSK